MAITNAGAVLAAQCLMNDTPTFLNAANAYLGVGNGNTAFSAAHTDLQGASKSRKGMEASYPTRSSGALTFRSVWPSGDGNFEWIEWGCFNAAAAGTMFSRKVESPSLGTKTSAQAWTLTATITVAAA